MAFSAKRDSTLLKFDAASYRQVSADSGLFALESDNRDGNRVDGHRFFVEDPNRLARTLLHRYRFGWDVEEGGSSSGTFLAQEGHFCRHPGKQRDPLGPFHRELGRISLGLGIRLRVHFPEAQGEIFPRQAFEAGLHLHCLALAGLVEEGFGEVDHDFDFGKILEIDDRFVLPDVLVVFHVPGSDDAGERSLQFGIRKHVPG